MTTLVYPVRNGDRNEELRYSLRSVEAHWPEVDEVWIVGYLPSWLTGVGFIRGNRFYDKPRAVYDNVRIACEDPDVPDEFVMMNDDFFALEPVDQGPPVVYRGPLVDHLRLVAGRCDWWERSLLATYWYLRGLGIDEPLSYELHRPLPTVKADMAKVLAEAADVQPGDPPQWRTLYGNLAGIGGREEPADVKVYARRVEHRGEGAWVSTTDEGWQGTATAERIRRMFPKRSRWERR